MRLVQPDSDRFTPPQPDFSVAHTDAASEPVTTPEKTTAAQSGPTIRSLEDIVALADQHRDGLMKAQIRRCVRPVRIEPGRLDVSLTEDAPRTLLNDLGTRLQSWTGMRWIVSLSREEGGATIGEQENARRESAFMDARNDPAVAAILARFPGAKIIDVRIPSAPDTDADETEPLPDPAIDDDDDE